MKAPNLTFKFLFSSIKITPLIFLQGQTGPEQHAEGESLLPNSLGTQVINYSSSNK